MGNKEEEQISDIPGEVLNEQYTQKFSDGFHWKNYIHFYTRKW